MFLSEEYGPSLVLSMFSNTGTSPELLQTVIIPDILSFAWEIDIDPVNFGRKTVKLVVEVLVQANDDEGNEVQVIDDSLSTLNFKPASRSSIQSLKRVKLGDEDQRTICLDELLDSDEVVWMPCGHVYHGGCIVRWLESSRLCPLCRYRMPN